MIIRYVSGHFEIVSAQNGEFIQSADTWDEAVSDLNDLVQQGDDS